MDNVWLDLSSIVARGRNHVERRTNLSEFCFADVTLTPHFFEILLEQVGQFAVAFGGTAQLCQRLNRDNGNGHQNQNTQNGLQGRVGHDIPQPCLDRC